LEEKQVTVSVNEKHVRSSVPSTHGLWSAEQIKF